MICRETRSLTRGVAGCGDGVVGGTQRRRGRGGRATGGAGGAGGSGRGWAGGGGAGWGGRRRGLGPGGDGGEGAVGAVGGVVLVQLDAQFVVEVAQVPAGEVVGLERDGSAGRAGPGAE